MKKKSKKKTKVKVKSSLAKKATVVQASVRPAKVSSKMKPLKKAKSKVKSSLAKKATTKKSAHKPVKKQKATKSTTVKLKSKKIKTAEKIGTENKRILELKKELAYLNEQKEPAQVIKDVKGQRYCHDERCDQPAVTDIYCRYHYLALWPKIQHRKNLLKDNYLLKTTHQLIRMFGEKALNFILHDLKSEKSLESALKEMNLSLLKEDTGPSPSEDIDF